VVPKIEHFNEKSIGLGIKTLTFGSRIIRGNAKLGLIVQRMVIIIM
jgi:hypothetical protein